MTTQQQITLIRQKCIEVNTDSLRWEYHSESGWDPENPKRKLRRDWQLPNRPIRLADVLLAIGNLKRIKYKTGGFSHPHNVSITTQGYVLNENGMHLFEWNLRKDDLTEQSEECITFLADLLQ